MHIHILAVMLASFVSLHASNQQIPTHVIENQTWKSIVEKVRNGVLQVHAQCANFDFHYPYKTPTQSQGSGSGFFISSEGLILTNFHVIDEAVSIQVCMPCLGKKKLDARIIGVCPEADVALLALEEESLSYLKERKITIPVLTLGDSDELYQTEEVLALGYPLGQPNLKSTTGVVAGKEYTGASSYIHITAPINPGNSGGPLLNKKGEVVGINSAIMSNSQNIGYIRPISDIRVLLDDLKRGGLVRRPDLGMKCNRMTDEHAKYVGAPLPAGLYVSHIQENSIAARAGIKDGALLYKINGFTVDQFGDVWVPLKTCSKLALEEYLMRIGIGLGISFDVFQDGKMRHFATTFVQSEIPTIRFMFPGYEMDQLAYEIIGGLCLTQLRENHLSIFANHPTLKQYAQPEKGFDKCVIITSIIPGSYIDKIRCFAEGDIIDSINGTKVYTLEDLQKALQASIKSGILEVQTRDKSKTIVSLDAISADETRICKDFGICSTAGLRQVLDKRMAASSAKK